MKESAKCCRENFVIMTCTQNLILHDIVYDHYQECLNLQSIVESDSTLEWSRHPMDEGFRLCGLT